MNKIIYALLVVILFSSCGKETVFEVDNSNYVPKIVINSLFQQNVPFEIVVSHSVNVYDTLQPAYLTTAEVKLYVNNAYAETLTPFGNGYYNATTIPQQGKTYKITVKNAGFNDAEAESTLPTPVKITDWSYIDSTLIDNDGKYFGELTFAIDDPLEENNYLLSLQFWDDINKEFLFLSEFTCDDQSLNENLAKRTLNGEYLFTDKLFNGKNKSFVLRVPSGYYIDKPLYLLKLYSVTKDSYFYSFSQAGNTSGVNTSPIYSNVKNGLGIFAGRSLDVDTIK